MSLIERGSLLIAEPFLKDPSFARTVTLICRYSENDGCFGFTINRQLSATLNELLEGLELFDWPVYDGGPVQKDTLHYIHEYSGYFDDSEKITDGLYWGGDFELLKNLMWAGKIQKDKIKFFLGYSGWSAGQLEDELKEKSWVVSSGTKSLIMETEAEKIWQQSLYDLGGKYRSMAHYPTDPQLN